MTDLNHVAVIGRITRDLDGKAFAYLPNGTARANVGIAVNRSRIFTSSVIIIASSMSLSFLPV